MCHCYRLKCRPPKFRDRRPNLQCKVIWRWAFQRHEMEMGRGGTSRGISECGKEKKEILLFPHCEAMARRWPPVSQDESPHQKPATSAPCSGISKPPELWEKRVSCLSLPVYDMLLQQLKQTQMKQGLWKTFLPSFRRERVGHLGSHDHESVTNCFFLFFLNVKLRIKSVLVL